MTDFTAYTLENAPEEAKGILNEVQSHYGFIPNLFSYMAEAPVTIEAYVTLNQLVEKSSLTPAQAQIALLTVSLENKCDFCSVAHRAMAKKANVNPKTLQALLDNADIEDKKDRALVQFTQAIVRERGWVSENQLNAFFDAGFSKQNVFEIILVVTIKTLSNYSNHLGKPEPNPELLAML